MSRGTLVIVDDDRSFVEALSIFLVDDGYRVVPAYCGQEAVTSIQNEHVDLAIIDVQLPDISGIEVAKEVHRAGKNIPLILISGDDRQEIRDQCREAGAWLFLPKPLVPEDLRETIFRILAPKT